MSITQSKIMNIAQGSVKPISTSGKNSSAIVADFHPRSTEATECAQQLWRYRPDVPMYVWVVPRSPFGYAETNARRIKEKILQTDEMTAFLIRINWETGKRGAINGSTFPKCNPRRHYCLSALTQLLTDGRGLLLILGLMTQQAHQMP